LNIENTETITLKSASRRHWFWGNELY
jgi:hypothetical protein